MGESKGNVLLGVTGSVAVYKAVDLASKLTGAGVSVRTVLTQNAARFAGAVSFESVTGQHVYTDMWKQPDEFRISHISIADWADAVAVVPADANIISKAACGICDDLLSTTLCACWEKKTLFAPAMNSRMWSNPAVAENVEKLKSRGVIFVGPEAGRLACGTSGPGRMAEPADIADHIEQLLS